MILHVFDKNIKKIEKKSKNLLIFKVVFWTWERKLRPATLTHILCVFLCNKFWWKEDAYVRTWKTSTNP